MAALRRPTEVAVIVGLVLLNSATLPKPGVGVTETFEYVVT